MNTVTIGTTHMYNDYGLITISRKISPPSPKIIAIDIPGADGQIDLTDALTGEVKFHNRKIEMAFEKIGGSSISYSTYRQISNKFHGQLNKITFSDMPGYYFCGRVAVDDFEAGVSSGQLKMSCDAQPYALELIDSTEPWVWDTFNFDTDTIRGYKDLQVDGTRTVEVYGSRKTVSPEFIVSAPMTVTFEGNVYNLAVGSNRLVNIAVVDGVNKMTFTGTGTVTIKFRGGAL